MSRVIFVTRLVGVSLIVITLVGVTSVLLMAAAEHRAREEARDQRLVARAALAASRIIQGADDSEWERRILGILNELMPDRSSGYVQVLVPVAEHDRRWRVQAASPSRPDSTLPFADPQVLAAIEGSQRLVTWLDPAGDQWRSALVAAETAGHQRFVVEARIEHELGLTGGVVLTLGLMLVGAVGGGWGLWILLKRSAAAGAQGAPARARGGADAEMVIAQGATSSEALAPGEQSPTQRQRQQREIADLRMQVARFQGADRAKTTLLVALCRSLRHSVDGLRSSGLIIGQTRLDRVQRDHLDILEAGHSDLAMRIGDVLDFALLEADCLSLDQRPLRPRQVLEEALLIVVDRCAQLPVELVWEADSSVPERVLGDLVRIRQVLVNLIGLAASTAEEGTVTVLVTAPTQHQLRFTISLMGVTLTADRIRLLLEGAISSDSTSAQMHSDGLSLVLGKRLAQAMGGSLQIERGAGDDIQLTCVLTIVAEDIPPERPLQGVSLILAHERPAILRMMASILDRAGAIVEAVGTQAELQNLRAVRPELRLVIASSRICAPDDAIEPALICAGVQELAHERALLLIVDPIHQGFASDLRAAGAKALMSAPIRQQAVINAAHQILNEAVRESGPELALALAHQVVEQRVLVVEDNQVNQLVLVRMLESFGITPEVANQGQEALDAINRAAADRPFTLVFMDCMMPVMDGLSATRAIRAAENPLQRMWIVAVTANALANDRTQCIESGMDDYLAKPVTPIALSEAISRWRRATKVAPSVAAHTPTAVDQGAAAETAANRAVAAAVPSAGAPNVVTVEFSGLATLARLAGRPAMIEVISCYLAESDVMHQAVHQAAESGEVDQVRAAAHKLKGSSATVGLKGLQIQAAAIETAARAGDLAASRARLPQLSLVYAASIAQLRAYRDRA